MYYCMGPVISGEWPKSEWLPDVWRGCILQIGVSCESSDEDPWGEDSSHVTSDLLKAIWREGYHMDAFALEAEEYISVKSVGGAAMMDMTEVMASMREDVGLHPYCMVPPLAWVSLKWSTFPVVTEELIEGKLEMVTKTIVKDRQHIVLAPKDTDEWGPM